MANALELQYLTNSMDSLSRALLGRRMRLDQRERDKRQSDDSALKRLLDEQIAKQKMEFEQTKFKADQNKVAADLDQQRRDWLSKQIDNVAEGVEKGFVPPDAAAAQLKAGLQGADEKEVAILQKLPKFNLLLEGKIQPAAGTGAGRFEGSGRTGDLLEAEKWYTKAKEAMAAGDTERSERYMEYYQLAKKSSEGYSMENQAVFNSLVRQLSEVDKQMRELKMSGTSADEIESSQREFNILKKYRDQIKREMEELRRGAPAQQSPQSPPSSGITPPPPALNTDIKTNAAGTTTMPIEGIIGPSETKKLKFNPLTGKIE